MQRILFVCTGNTCRSPMAEAILKSKRINGMEVKSAGVFAANGHPASPHAQQVLAESNLLHSHQSSLLTKTDVEWADLILAMTASHKGAILSYFPNASVKLFTLKEFSGDTVYSDVVDPYGGNLAMYRETFQELEKLIDQAIEKLDEEPKSSL